MKANRAYQLYLHSNEGRLLDCITLDSITDTTAAADREFGNRKDLEVVEMKEVVTVGRKVIAATRSIYLRQDYEMNLKMQRKIQQAKREGAVQR